MIERTRSVPTLRLGVTLIEVMIAISILVIGVLVVAQMQAVSLRNTALAQDLNETTRAVRGELEWQRATAIIPVSDDECVTAPDGYECSVDVVPCAYFVDPTSGAASFGCEPAVSVSAPSAYRVIVTATSPRGSTLTLSSMWTGTFVAGAAGAAEDGVVSGE